MVPKDLGPEEADIGVCHLQEAYSRHPGCEAVDGGTAARIRRYCRSIDNDGDVPLATEGGRLALTRDTTQTLGPSVILHVRHHGCP
jgi:hypothetical protein